MRLIRGIFIILEVALTLALLAGAGLLVRSFWRLQQVDPGFRADHLLTVRLSLSGPNYTSGAHAVAFFERLQERLAALPGVVSASATTGVMLPKLANSAGFTIEGRPRDPNELGLELPIDTVQPNYFQTMGVQLLKGRTFTNQDTRESPRVTIVNETFANRYFPNEDPLGKRFTFGSPGPNTRWITIVGVVRDTKRQGTPARQALYMRPPGPQPGVHHIGGCRAPHHTTGGRAAGQDRILDASRAEAGRFDGAGAAHNG
jgi:hypothetical protein